MSHEKNKDLFIKRLMCLRTRIKVSARDMSLSISQNPGYIHSIESGKSLPSMSVFFSICEYLNVTPYEFFSYYEDSNGIDDYNNIYAGLDTEEQAAIKLLSNRLKEKKGDLHDTRT